MIKVLHTADIHLDSPLRSLALRNEKLRETVQVATRDALSHLVDYALAERVSAILIAGDLFDGAARSAKTAAYLVRELDKLRKEGIRVFYIKGNHDAENPMTGEIALPDNVHVFDGRGSKVQLNDTSVWVHGVSFSGKHAPESLLHKFPAPVPHAVNIAMLHTSLAGASDHDPYAPCSVSELESMGFDYWALGHVHKRQIHSQKPWIVMPGMPQGRDIGEYGPKSATLVCIDEGSISIEEIPTAKVEFLTHTVDISSVVSDEQLRALIRDEFTSLANGLVSENAIVRFVMTGKPERSWQLLRDSELWKTTIEELAQDTGCLCIEKVGLDFGATSATQVDSGAVGELLNLMNDIREEEAFKAQMLEQVHKLLSQVPINERGRLIPDEASLQAISDGVGAEGAEYLYALMKGASQ